MASYHAPRDWKDRSDWIAAGLHGRARWRLSLLMSGLPFGHTLVELWSWHRSAAEPTDRKDSPWDDVARRPSHADRRKALQGACLSEDLQHALRGRPLARQFLQTLERPLRIAV